MKKADKVDAKMVLIAGEDELSKGKVVLRDMKTKEQKEIPVAGLIRSLVEIIKK